MLIAETIQFDIPAWFVALVLAILLLLVAGLIALLFVGFRAAGQAGEGSETALVLFVGAAALETLVGLYALVQRGFWAFWAIPFGIAALQVMTYIDAKRTR